MIIFAVVAALFVRLVSLGLYPLTDPTEGRYAEIGRRIVESADWVTPWLEPGVPFWGKPPLSFWMTGGGLQLLGESAFAARLPHFLAGVLIVWLVYDLFKRLNRNKTGQYAAALTAGSLILYISSGTIMTDAALALGCAIAMRGFWLAVNGPIAHRHRECYLFFIGLAIGLLAKGPVIIVISLIPIGLWTLYARQLRTVFVDLPWVRGLLLMLLITLPWYVLAEMRTPGFLEYFIVGEHWDRYLQKDWAGDLYGKGHGRPLGFIWLFALAAFVPWTILLPILAWLTRKAPRNDSRNDPSDTPPNTERHMLVYFALSGFFLLVFFSLSSNVLISYTLPSVAPLACLAALWLARRQAETAIRRTLVGGLVFTTLLSVTAVGYIGLTEEHKNLSSETLVQTWRNSAQADEPLYFYPWQPQSSKFYTSGDARVFKTIPDIEAAAAAGESIFIALKDDQRRAIPEALQRYLSDPQIVGDYTLFRMNQTK